MTTFLMLKEHLLIIVLLRDQLMAPGQQHLKGFQLFLLVITSLLNSLLTYLVVSLMASGASLLQIIYLQIMDLSLVGE